MIKMAAQEGPGGQENVRGAKLRTPLESHLGYSGQELQRVVAEKISAALRLRVRPLWLCAHTADQFLFGSRSCSEDFLDGLLDTEPSFLLSRADFKEFAYQ
jgi:hypothetical protein